MKKIGKQTIKFDTPPTVLETACIAGPKEADGPLAKYFDKCLEDEMWGEKSWEKAESKIVKQTVSFGLRELNVPFYGIFGACSTFVEGMQLASVFIEGGINYAICSASSHFCSSERQFRFPLELGNQRPPTSQWTVTACGSAMLAKDGNGPKITYITTGKIVDMGIKDANNMGAAMAPAAFDTLITHFTDTGRNPSYYDAILTGDLGHIGKDILIDLCKNVGYNIRSVYNDCGVLIFDKSTQDTHSGGSGCGCCASVFSGYLFEQLKEKKLNKILLIATGALMNSMSSQQGESIPGIAQAIAIENV